VVAADRRSHRRLLVVVTFVVLATAAGMAALWPRGDAVPAAPEPLEDLVAGEVEAVTPLETADSDPPGGIVRLRIRLLDGPNVGERVDLELNPEGYPEIDVGDRVALDRVLGPGGVEEYYLTDFQRLPTLVWLVGLFVVAVVAISRWHGLRSLIGLGLSLLIIVQFVIPAILAGSNPPLVALVGALAVMVVTLYLAHGVNEMTTAAVVGTAGALSLTVALGLLFISAGKITGFASDDAVFARSVVDGLDLQGLVLAGLIIAALGVLDDVTISQSSTVFALHDTDPTLGWPALFGRAMKVGRDHIASVVNTLFLAYAGASLALLVLFSTSGEGVLALVNSERLAEEIVKTVVGSLGLILAVPLTTALAASVAVARVRPEPAVVDSPPGKSPPPGESPPRGGSPPPADAELTAEQRAAQAWAAYLREQRPPDGEEHLDPPR